MSRRKRTAGLSVALACFAAFPVWAATDSHFSIALGSHEDLLIQGAGGSTLADVASDTVGRTVTVGDTAFEVSYGRDANGELTAILTPPGMGSVALHFSAGGKSVDADKAVVTLTFAPDRQGVLIDPGYVGTVEVDSHLLRAHNLADEQPLPPSAVLTPTFAPTPTDATTVSASDVATTAPAPSPDPAPAPAAGEVPATPGEAPAPAATPDATVVATTAPDAAVAPSPSPAPGTDMAATPAPETAPAPSAPSSAPAATSLTSAPPMLASQLAPILPPLDGASSSSNSTTSAPQEPLPIRRSLAMTTPAASPGGPSAPAAPGSIQRMKLYWSEPITAPDGTAPVVAPDEIKLVEVRGTVTVTEPNGTSQTGQEGMVVPSGSLVRTWDNSSAALFMGGVNSARLMPKCELVVTQTLAGSVRTDVVELHTGAVFSRVGHRDGETENYSVATPEGSSDAGAHDMLAFRGTPAELRGTSTASARLVLDPKQLLAWNPAATRGLVSDVPLVHLGILTPIGNIPSTYFYYTGGFRLTVNANQIRHEVLTNFSANASNPSQSEPDFVLQAILTTLQPFNQKLNSLLKAINNGTETPAQLTYYHSLISVFFDVQAKGLVQDFLHNRAGFYRELNIDSAMLWQDLREFNLPSLTPH